MKKTIIQRALPAILILWLVIWHKLVLVAIIHLNSPNDGNLNPWLVEIFGEIISGLVLEIFKHLYLLAFPQDTSLPEEND